MASGAVGPQRDRTDAAGDKPAVDTLAEVRRLELGSRRLVRDLLAGEYESVFKGRGVEFVDVREYQYGDDVRTIDWRVTARMDAAYVRRYAEERELTVVFIVDHSASDAFGSRVRTKIRLATEVCATLVLAAVRNNDRVGVALATDMVEQYVPPAKGRRHALRVLREMVTFSPQRAGTNLGEALAYVNRVLTRRAVVFVLSDWLTTGYEQELDITARRHDTIAIQLVDPRERVLPNVGLLTIRDPESGAWRHVDTGSSAVRAAFQQRAAGFDSALVRTLQARGVDLIRLETGRSYVAPLLRFFRRRERRRLH
jgi:uncharacterized protein (DUF58 family)